MTAIEHLSRSPTTNTSEQDSLPLFSVSGSTTQSQKVINVASVKHRSPFRYPGGKTWLVPVVRKWLGSFQKPISSFVEPFAGGGIVSLSALFDGYTDAVILIEKDSNVGAVWQVIASGDGPELAEQIVKFDVTEENVRDLLSKTFAPDDVLGRSLATIVRNRVQRGGIMAPGAGLVRNGENGRGLKSRWYPETLRNRLLDLHAQHSSIIFHSGDGIGFISQNAKDKDLVWFIDPPYTLAGRRLYVHSDLDHEVLFAETAQLVGPFLMTYDDTDDIRDLARTHGFQIAQVPMKNTHHVVMNELLISRSLDWFTR